LPYHGLNKTKQWQNPKGHQLWCSQYQTMNNVHVEVTAHLRWSRKLSATVVTTEWLLSCMYTQVFLEVTILWEVLVKLWMSLNVFTVIKITVKLKLHLVLRILCGLLSLVDLILFLSSPFVCKSCGASFKTKANLLNHQPTHTGEKKYFCELCGQQFAHKTSLTLHYRWHTGE
jgi:uncharacterized Zn-finger protein